MLLIKAKRLIDGSGKDPIENGAVLIDGHTITYAGPESGLPAIPEGTEVREFTDHTLLPGFIDTHVHLTGDPIPGGKPEQERSSATLAIEAARRAWSTLLAGFTTVRDVGGQAYVEMDIRDAIEEGVLKGSRVLASGHYITTTGGRPGGVGPKPCEVDGADDARRGARLQLGRGADVIKLMVTGNVTNPGVLPGAQQLTEDEIRAATEAAHMAGKKVTVHAQGNAGIKAALRAGVDSIDHGFELDEEAIEMMLENHVYLIPTLSAVHWILEKGREAGIPDYVVAKAEEAAEVHARSFEAALAAGVPIALGTDAGTPFNLHGGNGLEFRLLVEYGMTPMQAIVAGTSAAAHCCGLDDRGLLAEGKLADVNVVEGDPLQDISVLENAPALIVQHGNVIVPEEGPFGEGN